MKADEFYDEFKAAMRHLDEWPGKNCTVYLSGDSFIMERDGRQVSFTVGSTPAPTAPVKPKQYPCFCRPQNCKITSEVLPDNQYCKRLRA